MTPNTRTNPARQPAGTPVGGQFAQEAKPPAGIALNDQGPGPSFAQIADDAAGRIVALEEASAPAVRAQTLVAARGLAAMARTKWPDAATIVTGECDQLGCIRQHAEEVLDADGKEVGQMWELDGYEQEIIDMEAGLAPVLGQDVFSVSGNDYDGEGGVIDVERALKPERAQTTAADRVKETIGGYRARFTDLDLDTRTAARDLLTDLHHWARAEGVDFDDLVRRAGEVADEEEAVQ